MSSDTIAAIATPPGRGGIGVIRLSGPQVRAIAHALLGTLPPPRQAYFSAFQNAKGETLDTGVALFFPGPHSFTGEDVLELQGHGSPIIQALLLETLCFLGARLAQPGEFSKRAFLNGKIDLAQAESIFDLIHANSKSAACAAMRSLQGAFSQEINALLKDLIAVRTFLEASLDFPDEGTDFLKEAHIFQRIHNLLTNVQSIQETAHQGSLLREGIHVALVGAPNVGKSSLLNALAGEDRALVTPLPGTTRDVIRESIILEGILFHIHDTAGLRETEDFVERLGIERTYDTVGKADLVVLLNDMTSPISLLPTFNTTKPSLTVYNKIDLVPPLAPSPHAFYISAKTGEGLLAFKQALLKAAGWHGSSEGLFSARQRHLEALAATAQSLEAALEHKEQIELCAEELRQAQESLNTITGRFTADDLLGEIFSSFCIGK